MPTKSPCHPLHFGSVAAIFINVGSRYSMFKYVLPNETAHSSTWWKTAEFTFVSQKWYEIGEKVNYKVVEGYRFATKRHLIDVDGKNRTVKT